MCVCVCVCVCVWSGERRCYTTHTTTNARLDAGEFARKEEAQVRQGVKNGRYMHAVPVDPDQPIDQPRFSLVFRPITDHPKGQKRGEHLAPVDEEQAARVRPGGDLFRPYNPLCRGGQGFREFL